MKARYVRISTSNQKIERQIIQQYPNEKIYIDIISGTVPFSEREQSKKLLEAIKNSEINYLTVNEISRLGRNLYDILTTIELLNKYNTTLKVDNLGIESLVNGKPNSAFKLIISVMANIAEMERETMLERQRTGIAIAKAKGLYKGRIRGSKESDEQFLAKYKSVVKELNQNQSLRKTAKLCDVSLSTVQKVKKVLVNT